MEQEYIKPQLGKSSFHCPMCNVFAQQFWSQAHQTVGLTIKSLKVADCGHCKKHSVWQYGEMVYPKLSTAPLAREDMPEDVKKIYEEARDVAGVSARATAALLRVALEKLTIHLGETEGTLNTRIKNLKDKGLPEEVIMSLDIVRITANEGGSHSGQIDLESKDNSEIVDGLFLLVNFIVEKTISDQKRIKEMFKCLPENKTREIKNRDK